MIIIENFVKREATPQELAAMEREAEKAEAIAKQRPMTEAEVSSMMLTQQINTLAVDDHTALRMRAFYPEWAAGTAYTAGHKVQQDDRLWRCRQTHTAQPGWEPGEVGTESLWEQINEIHAGTLGDPIPYSGNMALTEGMYYLQDEEIYLCTRDTENPVTHPLAQLVGLYVEIA